MLLLLLAGIYAVLVPLGVGIWLVRLLRAGLGQPGEAAPGALATWLGGLALLTATLEVASLLGPLHTAAHLGAAAVGAAGLGQLAGRQLLARQWQQVRHWHPLAQGLALLLLGYALFIGAMPSPNLDTGIYHAQSVRWLEEVGVVPGLANADVHIGFNSAWFVPEALFSWGRYVGSPLQVLNAVFFILFGWYCLAGFDRLLRRRARLADVGRLLLLLAMFQLLSDLASLSPDPAVALLLFFIVLQVLELPAPSPGWGLTVPQLLVVVLCLFATTVKLSTLPVLLLPAWWLVAARRNLSGRLLLALGACGVVLIGPWVARNVVISGYLVFPVALDVLPVSWKFPLAEMRLHSDYIKEFARNRDLYGRLSVLHTPWQFWVPIWWRTQQSVGKAVLLALPVLLVASPPLAWWQYRRGQLPLVPQLLLALALTLAGALFWFALAPAFRFGLGFLLPLLVLLLLPWLAGAARRRPRQLAAALALALLLLLLLMPLQMHYSYYYVPAGLSRVEYRYLQQRLPAAADQALLRRCFPRTARDSVWRTGPLSGLARGRLELLVASTGGLPGRGGFDGTGRSGFFGAERRLVWPAPYPIVAVQPLQLGAVQVVQSQQDRTPWYAPYPFVNRRKLCLANGPRLRDGFRPRLVRGPRNWFEDGRW